VFFLKHEYSYSENLHKHATRILLLVPHWGHKGPPSSPYTAVSHHS